MKLGEDSLVGERRPGRVGAKGQINDRGVTWKISTAAQDFRERQITGPDERHAILKAPEFILELGAPEFVEHSGTQDHEHVPGLRQHLQDVIDEPGVVVVDRNGRFVLAQRRAQQKSFIHRREQERRVGKELRPILAREYRRGAGDGDHEIGRRPIGIRGTYEVDDCLLGRTDKPRRTHDDLNHVRRIARRALVQFDTKVAGEVVDDQDAAIEGLQ